MLSPVLCHVIVNRMAGSAMRELQLACLPAAIGTIGVVYSNITNMRLMSKVRYAGPAGRDVHPYKPWADDAVDAEPHFRAFKACQNGVEWTVYAVPVLWLYVLYTPAIPYVGTLLSWAGAALGLAFGYFNVRYVEGYIVSSEQRLKPFYQRTRTIRALFYGAGAGIVASVVQALGFGL